MRDTDKDYFEICSINFTDKAYILQEIINSASANYYALVDSNNKKDELYTCEAEKLGNMLEFVIKKESEVI